MFQDRQETCVRLRIEGKTRFQIDQACQDMGIQLNRIFPKNSTANGYSFYGYGNSRKRYAEFPEQTSKQSDVPQEVVRRIDRYADEFERQYANEEFDDALDDAFPFGLIDH